MTSKEWLDLIKQAADYNPAMTNLIEKYGEMLVQEYKDANKNIIISNIMKNCKCYEQDNTTAMNCKHCGQSKWMHGGNNML